MAGVGLAMAGVGSLALAQAPASPDLHPLVKLHDTHSLAAGPALVSATDHDLFITRGGVLDTILVTRQSASGASFETETARGTGSATALAALESALGAAHVGQQSGVCNTELFPLGSTFRYEITWFGRFAHESSFILTNLGDATTDCSPQQLQIASALLAFESSVLADPATVIERSSCASNADCSNGLLCCPACAVPGCAHQCTAAVNGGCPLIP
jgi:hypothetical protein